MTLFMLIIVDYNLVFATVNNFSKLVHHYMTKFRKWNIYRVRITINVQVTHAREIKVAFIYSIWNS